MRLFEGAETGKRPLTRRRMAAPLPSGEGRWLSACAPAHHASGFPSPNGRGWPAPHAFTSGRGSGEGSLPLVPNHLLPDPSNFDCLDLRAGAFTTAGPQRGRDGALIRSRTSTTFSPGEKEIRVWSPPRTVTISLSPGRGGTAGRWVRVFSRRAASGELFSELPNQDTSLQSCADFRQTCQVRFAARSTRHASTSTATDFWSSRTDKTSRNCLLLRTRIPSRPSSGPALTRTQSPHFRNGIGFNPRRRWQSFGAQPRFPRRG